MTEVRTLAEIIDFQDSLEYEVPGITYGSRYSGFSYDLNQGDEAAYHVIRDHAEERKLKKTVVCARWPSCFGDWKYNLQVMEDWIAYEKAAKLREFLTNV